MESTAPRPGKFTFSVDSSLLFQLGEQLVAKPSVALAELAKNAYDADAKTVTVTMADIAAPGGTMLVEDDGHGMTFEELRDGWMRIATTQKRVQPVSRRHRRALTGAKGIGRFAARRLGDRLTLQTVATRRNSTKEMVVATFDWAHAFLPGENLVRVTVPYTRHRVPPDTATGVTLLIEGMRDAWTDDDIAALKRDVLSLQSPFPDLVVPPALPDEEAHEHSDEEAREGDPGFDFVLKIEGMDAAEEGVDTPAEGEDSPKRRLDALGDEFLGTSWARLDGIVEPGGGARYEFRRSKTGEDDTLNDDRNSYPGLDGARFRIYFMVYKSQNYEGSPFGVRDAQRKGREDGGVRIYLDGFRVFPYGDPGDDWLQLDQHAARNIDMATAIDPAPGVRALAGTVPGRPFLLIPKNQQVFGAVAISQTRQAQLGVNISRERLLETPALVGLRRFVQNGIYWMTIKYAAFSAEQQEGGARTKARNVPEIIGQARAAVLAQAAIPDEQRYLIIHSLDEAADQARADEEGRITEIAMLRTLASAGTTHALMSHQLQALIGSVLQTREDLRRLRTAIPEDIRERYDEITTQVEEWHALVEQQVAQFGFLLSPDSRQRRRRHALHEVVKNVQQPMSYYMRRYGVVFENNVPRNLRTPPIYQAELYAVLINVLSNALKFVHGQPERRVAVDAERVDGTLYIRMRDTGVGVPTARREAVFLPFVTTSVPNPVLGIGTGLGLKVVRDILDLYGGTARFIDTERPWKACIEMVLPERGMDGGGDDDV